MCNLTTTELTDLLQCNILKAVEIGKGKPVNERTNQETFTARAIIKDGLPPIHTLTLEDWLPFGIEVQKQSSRDQPDSFYIRAARFEWEWAVNKFNEIGEN